VQGCLRAGARGYLLKEAGELRLREQILTVVAGHVALDPRVADLLVNHLRQGEPPAESLIPREPEVLRLVAQGLTKREIGERLGLSQHRVKGDMKRILGKLGASSRVEAVLVAREPGLI